MSTTEASVSPWLRMYEREAKSIHIPVAEVTGEVPAELRGVHYRVGPAGGRAYGQALSNAFADSDGYVCAYTFGDSGVSVRGEFVRTSMYERERAAGRLITSTFGTIPMRKLSAKLMAGLRGVRSIIPPLSKGKPAPVKDSPNHVPCVLGGKLIVIGGAGAPHALRTSDLTTIGLDNFGGALPDRSIQLIGESHLDPASGDRCFLEICTYPQLPGVRLWSVSPAGHGRGSRRIPLPKVYLPHDFGLTETKIILPAGSIYASIPKLLLALFGIGTLNEAFGWHEKEATLFYVIDRKTHAVRIHRAPASYPVHVANAFDDGDDVVLDMNVHNDDACVRGFTAAINHDSGHPDFTNRLHRIRLNAGGGSTSEELLPFDCEVPYTSEAREGRRSRFVYASVTARGIAGSDRIVKVDAETRVHSTFSYGADCVAGQPVFVPRPGATTEDDGWVLCQVYDGSTDASFLSVVDADLGKELARVRVPGALPYLLHGKFVPAEGNNDVTG